MTGDAETEAERNDRRIAWALSHPNLPAWMKDALRASLEQHPVDAANHAETLRCLLAARAATWAAHEFTPAPRP